MGKYIIVPNISYSLDNLGQLLDIDENILYGKAIIVRNASFASNNLGQVTFINEPVGPTGETEPVGPTGETEPVGPTGETEPIGPTGETGQTGPIEPDYSTMYFTIESLQDSNQIKMQRSKTPNNPTLSYSLDEGETWTTVTISGAVTFGTINTGDKIIFKGNNTRLATAWDAYNYFTASKQFKVYGNIMSLLNGDDFKENSEFDSSSTHNFAGLFRTTYIVDASNLILPASTCTTSCYNGMFRGCTNLITAPELPAINSAQDCYSSMFEGCINLEIAPEINLVNMSQNCCKRMFCMDRNNKITTPKMTKSPILRCATGASGCYEEMFKGNGNLIEVTCLKTDNTGCCENWLLNCSSVGTFYKSPLKTNWPSTTSGIPSNWTVVDYVEE